MERTHEPSEKPSNVCWSCRANTIYTCIWDASFLMTHVDFEIMLGLCGAYWNMISNNRIINYVSCFVDLQVFLRRYANNTSTHSQLIGNGHVTKITVRPKGWKSSGRFDCAEKALQGQCRSVSWSSFWRAKHGKTTPTRNRCARV